jgi:hypothetical protein
VSVSAARANTPAAIASPFGVSSSSATTTTGTSRMRRTVSAFGTLSWNTDQVSLPQPDASAFARAKTSSSIGSVSFPVNVFCWEG